MHVQKKNEKLPKNKSSRRKTLVKGSSRKKGHNVKSSMQKRGPSPSSKTRKTSSGSLEKVVPKNKIITKQEEVDESAVKNILEKYKSKKPTRLGQRLSTTDLLTLDRVSKKSIRVPSQKQKSTKSNKGGGGAGQTSTQLYSSHSTDEPSEDGADHPNAPGAKKADGVDEDKYDEYPKIEEILKTSKENVYTGGGQQPKWMSYIEPTDVDMVDIEPPCTVGSEQIEMYHDKKFKLHCPPEGKLRLDQWEKTKNMSKRDELFFTPPLVFSNTIRSLINVAEMGKKKGKKGDTDTCTGVAPSNTNNQNNKDDVLSPTQADEYCSEVSFIDIPTKKVFIYERSDPIVSASRRIEGNEADFKTDNAIPTEFLNKFI